MREMYRMMKKRARGLGHAEEIGDDGWQGKRCVRNTGPVSRNAADFQPESASCLHAFKKG